ncbi:right-handed parallel beta-helix repeat-containing protein [Polyangium sp. 6x1]|uniref:right-handed parallel beta-helix repeat-containing protein n=1 Tax=Polyangium sp. 6x1 TaxID=3042689 RepID=UPI0024824169|nr:right-handed parallel beta-helix repeat-containing protein [Polyangium sp. 6x1]MDI1451787.1 right-handed parallel beta-helix repeat-containing protein [Polyangium sp. 6x1]
MQTRAFSFVASTTILLLAASAHAAEFYVDPANGSPDGDGSAAKPWQSLEQLIADGAFGTTIKAGDTVWLRSGYHGAPVFKGGDYTPAITIAAAPGEKPTAASVAFKGAKGWTLRGLSISPSHAPAPAVGDIVLIDPSSARVTVEDNEIFSVADSSSWGPDEWINAASSGIFVRGEGSVARNNSLTNVRFGISVDGKGALVEKNRIVNFSADGLRGLGDDGVFQYNLIKNVYVSQEDGDANHDDGFQSWSVGANGVGTGAVKNVTLRGNVFINREDPNQKLTNSMQGIGCFDGFFEGWVVENNVVVTDHWHGISFYGMRNSRIVNNTVIDVNDESPGPPWIKVTAHKDGTASQDVVVRNNLSTDFQLEGTNVTDDHNTKLTDLAAFFVAPASFDLHLLPGSPAVDTGSPEMAPALDIEGIPRPQGAGVDLGAYEWHEPDVGPVDGGIGGNGGEGGAGASTTGTGGQGGSGGDETGTPGANGGCGCAIDEGRAPRPLWALVGLAVGFAWRRRGRGKKRLV